MRLVWDVPFWWFAGGYVAGRGAAVHPPVQALVLTPLFGARRPTEAELGPHLRRCGATSPSPTDLPPDRYILRVLPSDELNAFACGGHLVVVTTFAIDELPRRELAGVLAHELSHHLGLHTVGADDRPLAVAARRAAWPGSASGCRTSRPRRPTRSPRGSSALTILGQLVAGLLNVLSLPFVAALYAADALGNVVVPRPPSRPASRARSSASPTPTSCRRCRAWATSSPTRPR